MVLDIIEKQCSEKTIGPSLKPWGRTPVFGLMGWIPLEGQTEDTCPPGKRCAPSVSCVALGVFS